MKLNKSPDINRGMSIENATIGLKNKFVNIEKVQKHTRYVGE